MKKNSRIFVAGHSGILAQALLRRMRNQGFAKIVTRTPAELDLSNQRAVTAFFKSQRPEYCFLPSVKEGGIAENITHPAELMYRNLSVQTNIMHAAYQTGVKKLLFFASSCVYPRACPQPIKERYLLSAGLEPTNEPYAVAKIAGIKLCQAYNREHHTQFISLIPATIFGPQDNFDLNSAHVIAALIRKFTEAGQANKSTVTVWGTAKARREFIYVDDLADAGLFLMQGNHCVELINVGTGIDVSIRHLAKLIKDIVGFQGKIKFDGTKPEGTKKKLLDSSRINSLGWTAKTSLEAGLKTACAWYLKKSAK